MHKFIHIICYTLTYAACLSDLLNGGFFQIFHSLEVGQQLHRLFLANTLDVCYAKLKGGFSVLIPLICDSKAVNFVLDTCYQQESGLCFGNAYLTAVAGDSSCAVVIVLYHAENRYGYIQFPQHFIDRSQLIFAAVQQDKVGETLEALVRFLGVNG